MVVARHDLDRGILCIDELEMRDLRSGANARVEIVVLKGQHEARQRPTA